MVAVISGNGLGLGNTSQRTLGGQGGPSVLGQGGATSDVNIATGNLVLQGVDEGVLFDGLSLAEVQTYNSLGQLSGSNGWRDGFSRHVGGLVGALNTAGSTVTRTADDGSTVTYVYDATQGVYVSQGQSGAEDTLRWDTGTSTWTWADAAAQQQETYDSTGQLATLSNPASGAIYRFSYTGGRLSQVTAGDGDVLQFGYDTAGRLISMSIQEVPPGQTTAVTRQAVSYAYDSQGRLSSVTTNLASDTDSTTASYTIAYTYDGTSNRITAVTQSDGTVASYAYTQDAAGIYQVTGITTGSGAAAQLLTLSYGTGHTTVTDGLGQATTYQYDAVGRLTAITAPAVGSTSPTTTYTYDANGNVLTMTDPDRAVTTYTYDARGNRLSAEDGAGHVVSYTYNAQDQVTSQTLYTVPAQGVPGQSGYVASSGAQTSYTVYTAAGQPAYAIDPEGNVTEYDYTTTTAGLSELATVRHYLGASYGLGGLSPSTPPTLAQLQAWVASSAVQATLGQTTRTDYAYDVRGQLTSLTRYATVDAQGHGVLDPGAQVTQALYGAQGQLLQSSTVTGTGRATLQTTRYAYDGLGRRISATDPLGNVTHYVYTDSTHTLAITQANGLTTTQIYDSAGRLIGSVQSASGQTSRTTTYLYDADGREVARVDPLGEGHYTFYDADGRTAGTVDASGDVTAYAYDADGRVIGATQYATPVSLGGWLSGRALGASFPTSLPVPTANSADRTTTTIYTADGQVAAVIDPAGAVTTTTYDGAGRALATTRHAVTLTAAQRTALGAAPTLAALQADLTASGSDRTTLKVYDADGRMVAVIDPAGYVTTTGYDAIGNVVLTRAYATELTAAQRSALGSAPTLAALQADLAGTSQDQVTRTYYDAAGRTVAQVDAAGYLSTTAYDETALTTTTARYAIALTAAQLGALTGTENVAALVALLGTQTAHEQSQVTADADGRTLTATAVDGTVTAYTYNTLGQMLSITVTPASGQGAVRTTQATYDAFGEQVTAQDAAGAVVTTTYNAQGQATQVMDGAGNSTWYYYDADGQLIYAIQGQPSGGVSNVQGNVTATTYNAFGQVAGTRTYASPLTLVTSGGSSGTTLNLATATVSQVQAAIAALPVVASDVNGQVSYTYSLDGQVVGQVDGRGYQTVYSYDAFNDRTQVEQQRSAPGSAASAANSTISTFAYDVRGEQTSESDGVGTAVARTTHATYDAYGRVTSTTDGNGYVTTYAYDNLNQRLRTSETVSGYARTTQTTYDAFGQVLTRTDALGHVTAYQYDVMAHTATVTTSDGVMVTTVKDAYGDMVRVTDGAGGTTTYTYDADGRLHTTTNPLGQVTTDQYDADGHLTQVTDAAGTVTTYAYDATGRVLSRVVDPTGLALATTYAYDAQGRQLSVTDPTGMVTTYAYDASGNVLTQVEDAGTGKLNLATTYTYDGAGKVLTVTAGAGTSAARTTQYVYDNLKRLSQQIVDPGTGHLNLTTTYTYDANDNRISVTDANGHTNLYVYDQANELQCAITPTGTLTRYVYNTIGCLTEACTYAVALTAAQLSALGNAPTLSAVTADVTTSVDEQLSFTAYDSKGRVRYQIDPQRRVTETRYDAAGNVSEVLAYANQVTLTAAEETLLYVGGDAALASVASLVSGAGNTDANAEATAYLYDADGQVRFTVQQNTVNGQLVGQVSERRYDAAGRVVANVAYGRTLTLSASAALNAQLTTAGVAAALAGAPSHATRSVYDAAGRLRYTLDATNHVTETQVDANGRVVKQLVYANPITVPSSLTVTSVAAAVTAAGTTGARFTTTTYDAAGRITATGDALGTRTRTTYDATGLQLTQSDRDGHVTTLTYDKAGRTVLEQSPAVTVGSYSGSTLQTTASQYLYTSYSYDGVGNVTVISQGYGSSASAITTVGTTTYAYDAANHQIQTTYPGGVSTQVVYNALGQAVADQDANGHWQYKAYDTDGRVVYAVDANGYVTGTSYDAYGNVAAVTRYATALKTSAISGWSAGQPLSQAQVRAGLVTSGNDRTITTTYDQGNRKIQVQQSAISYALSMGSLASTTMAAASPTTTYTYDAYGNQTSTSALVQGALTSGSTSSPAVWATTYTYYDALNRAVMVVTPTGLYTAPQGYVTTTTYDAFGDVTATTQYAQAISTGGISTATPPALPGTPTAASGANRVTTIAYDAIGRKASETDTGTYSYTGGMAGQLNGTAGAASASRVTTWTYDGEDHIATVTANGATTLTTYDALGRVLTVTAPARKVLVSNWQALLEQNPAWDLTSATLYTTTSPVTTLVYDAQGHVLAATTSAGGLSQRTLSHYDARGNETSTTDADGTITSRVFDNNGNVLSEAYTLAGATTATTTYAYDADNQQLSTITQRSGQTGYDQYVRVQYNAFGEVVAKGDNAGYEATYTYNNAGQQIAAPDSKTSAIQALVYDLTGGLVIDRSTVTGSTALTWTTNVLTLDGRIQSEATPSSTGTANVKASLLHYTYDRWGNVTSVTDNNGNVTTDQYDSQNHVIEETEASVLVVSATGTRTTTTPTRTWYYNVAGQLMGAADENGHSTWTAYGTDGSQAYTKDATGALTYTAYDALGRAVARQTPSVQTGTGTAVHITWSAYDARNQVTAQGDFLPNAAGTARTQQTQQAYVLDADGNRLQVTDALGNTSYYTYDSQGRVLTSQTATQHAAGKAETFTYDANGCKTGDTTADGDHQSWTYDYFGRVLTHVDLSGATTTYTYDANSGLLTTATSNWTPAGQTNPGYLDAGWNGSTSQQTYSYYADGQVAQITDTVGSAMKSWDTYQYDANGNRTVDASYTADGSGQVLHTETLTRYDSHNRISVVTTENPDTGTPTTREVYNYDAAGNRRAVFVQSAYGSNASPIAGNGSAPTGTIGAQTLPPGQAWSLNVDADFTDNIGFGLTYGATQANGAALPSWMSFSSNGVFSGTPTTAGSWSIAVTATDVNGQSVRSTFTITVPVVAPVFTGGASNQAGSVHGALSFAVPGATDANGSALAYTATCNGGSLPSWLSFNASTRTFSGTPPVGSIGSYALKVTATAANGGSAAETFTLTVAPTPPVYVSGVGNQTTYGGRAFSFAYPASDFSEADGDALSFSAGIYTIVNGVETDGALPSWMSFDPGTRTFSGTPPTSVVGQNFTLYLRGTNPQGQSAQAIFTVGVAQYVQPAPVYHGTLANQTGVIGGASLNLPLPSGAFTEPDGGALTYTGMVLIPQHVVEHFNPKIDDYVPVTVAAAWVALSQVGLSVNATTGAITGVPTVLDYTGGSPGGLPDYRDSTYQIEIIATNAQGGTATGSFTLTNSFASPASVAALASHSVAPGSGAIAEVPAGAFSDPYGQGLTYSATLASGAGLPGGLSWSGTSLSVGTAAAGSYAIRVTVTDGLGRTANTTFTLTVTDAAPVWSGGMVNHAALQGVAMASFQLPAATDANGDAITYSATGLPPGVSFNASTRTFSGTPTAIGTYTVTYKAADSQGASVSGTFQIGVTPQQPPVYNGGIPASITFALETATYVVPATTFSSPEGYALTYSSNASATGWLSFNPNTRTFQAAIDDSDHGPATITLTATDSFGHSVSITFSASARHIGNPKLLGNGMVAAVPSGGLQPLLVPIGGGGDGTGGSGGGGSGGTGGGTGGGTTPTPDVASYWFTYDADNRVVVSDGALSNGQIRVTSDTASYELGYDAAGNEVLRTTIDGTSGDTMTQASYYDLRSERVRADYTRDMTTGGANRGVGEERQYDAAGHLTASEQFFALGTTANINKAIYYKFNPDDIPDDGTGTDIGADLATATVDHYDADGRLEQEQNFGHPAHWDGSGGTGAVPGQAPAEGATSWGGMDLLNQVTYRTASGASGYDASGNVVAYHYDTLATATSSARTDSYTVSYLKKDGYLEQATSGTSSDSNYRPATDTSDYDAFGQRNAIVQHVTLSSGTLADTVRIFALDAGGQILQRRDGQNASGVFQAQGGAGNTHYAYVNGQQVGAFDEAGAIDVLDGLTAFSDAAAGTTGYVTQYGDTLESIAQAKYGNASLWYVVAQANGLSGDSDLVVGQTLTIPQVTTHQNDATTFKPYNPQAIAGSTTPALPNIPPPPPASGHHCNALAEIVVIAVVVVATIVTAGAAAVALGAVASGTSVFAAGATVLAGEAGLTAAAMGAAFAGGVVGNIAGQLTGDALGVSHGFSLSEAVTNGLATAITAGVGSELSAAGKAGASTLADSQGVLQPMGSTLYSIGSYAANVAANKVTGQPEHFSWAGVVASAVSSGLTSAVGMKGEPLQRIGAATDSSFTRNVAGGLLSGGLDREISQLLGDSHVQGWEQVGEDAFGNALGNAAVEGIRSYEASTQHPEPAATSQITGVNGAPGFQYNDGVQTFALPQGGMADGGDDLPGPFIDVSGTPFTSAPTLGDLVAQLRALRSRVENGSISTEEFNQAIATLNSEWNGIQGDVSTQQGNTTYGTNAGTGTTIGQPLWDDHGVMNVPIYGGRVLTGSVQGMAGVLPGEAEGGWGTRLAEGLDNVLTGAIVGSLNAVYQPIAQVHDLVAVGYGLIKGGGYQPDYWSSIGQHAVTDRDPWDHMGQNLLSSNPITGLPYGAYQAYQSIKSGDYASVEQQAGSLAAMVFMGKAGGALADETIGFPGTRIEPTIGLDVPNSVPTGAFNPISSTGSGEGFGILAESQVTVTQKGLDLVSGHLSQFGDFPPNQMMLDRLQAAMDAGTPVTGADAVFYTHEASEATMMSQGMTYDDAHAAALEKYGVSPFSVYHPDVVQANPGWLNQNWRNFWGLK